MSYTEKNFSLIKAIKGEPPVSLFLKRNGRHFSEIKNAVLGRNFNLSLVFIGEKKSRTINRIYRKKDRGTNVLSFPLSKTEGEIFINLTRVKTEAKKFNRDSGNFVFYLLIHALCHLKGMRHGSTMEREERKYRKIFGV